MFYQIFFSLQVTRYTIITFKHDIHKLPHGLPKDSRHFRRWGGQGAHTRKKRLSISGN